MFLVLSSEQLYGWGRVDFSGPSIVISSYSPDDACVEKGNPNMNLCHEVSKLCWFLILVWQECLVLSLPTHP